MSENKCKKQKSIIATVKVMLEKTFDVKLNVSEMKPYQLAKFNSPYKGEVFKSPKVQKELRKLSKTLIVYYSGNTVYGFLVNNNWDESIKILKKLDKLGVRHLLLGEICNDLILFEFF